MGKFSDRIGITIPDTEIQINSMSESLRNSLWNYIVDIINAKKHISWYYPMKEYYVNYFKLPIDEIPQSEWCREELKDRFYECEWYEVYNIIEFTMNNMNNMFTEPYSKTTFEDGLNSVLKRELSGYRSINFEIVPITEESEVKSIQESIILADKHNLLGIKSHFATSLKLLGQKPEPDYKNSIKESISAVEGLCKTLSGEKSGGLEKALNKIDSQIKLHPAFKKGLLSLYGYTSDENGIRHPILEETTIGYSEAKYMLVSCSSFVNYLIDKAIDVNLLS